MNIDSFSIRQKYQGWFLHLKKNLIGCLISGRMLLRDSWRWKNLAKWSYNQHPLIDFQDIYICYYSAPKKKPTLNSLDGGSWPELIKYFDRFGVSLTE
jgi:hypothetical protein